MNESSNHPDPYRERVQRLCFGLLQRFKHIVVANWAGVPRQFLGQIAGGINRKPLPLRALLSVWEHGDDAAADDVARLLMELRPDRVIARRAVTPCADPGAKAFEKLRRAVNLSEKHQRAVSDNFIDADEWAEQQALADEIILNAQEYKAGLAALVREQQQQQQQQGARKGQQNGSAAGRNVGGAGRPRTRI